MQLIVTRINKGGILKCIQETLASGHGCVGSKPRNNALHAFCGIETIVPAATQQPQKECF